MPVGPSAWRIDPGIPLIGASSALIRRDARREHVDLDCSRQRAMGDGYATAYRNWQRAPVGD